RIRAAARRRLLLAEPPPARLAEPRLAPLPRGPRGDDDDAPLRRAGLRDVRLGRRRFLARRATLGPRDGRRRRGARPVRADGDVGWLGAGAGVHDRPPGAGLAADP